MHSEAWPHAMDMGPMGQLALALDIQGSKGLKHDGKDPYNLSLKHGEAPNRILAP